MLGAPEDARTCLSIVRAVSQAAPVRENNNVRLLQLRLMTQNALDGEEGPFHARNTAHESLRIENRRKEEVTIRLNNEPWLKCYRSAK